MLKFRFLIFVLPTFILLSPMQAMLHQLPATDDDMIKLARKYPAVGKITEVMHYEDGRLLTLSSTGTLITIPHRPDLNGRAVLTAKHCFKLWKEGSTDFSFTITHPSIGSGDEDKTSIVKITHFLGVPDVEQQIMMGCWQVYQEVYVDLGIAILETPIEGITPMSLHLGPLDLDRQQSSIVAVGYGFNGRLDLGVLVLNDGIKRATEFYADELEYDEKTNPSAYHDHKPFYLVKYNKGAIKDELIRGQMYQGDSGGPVIARMNGQDKIIGVCANAEHKKGSSSYSRFFSYVYSLLGCPTPKEINYQPTFSIALELAKLGLSETEKENLEDIESILKGNTTDIPPFIKNHANPHYQDAVIKEEFTTIIGVSEWIQNFDDLTSGGN